MSLWQPKTRPTSTKNSSVRILDAAGNFLREIEPDFGGPPCRKHQKRGCGMCEASSEWAVRLVEERQRRGRRT